MAKANETKVVNVQEQKQEKKSLVSFQFSDRFTESLKAIGVAFLVAFILILVVGQWKNIPEFILSVFTLSFGSSTQFANFLGKIAYMIPLGLALAVSFRMGLFNIGSAGQAIGGGLAAYMFGAKVDMGGAGFIFTLAIGIVVGMLVAMLIAFLKNQFNIHEVISSIMINWIIFYILKMFAPGAGESITLFAGNDLRMDWLSGIFGTGTHFNSINIGIILVLPIIPILIWAYKKTMWGYKQELIGNNKNVGKYVGINEKTEVMKTMMLSGALSGLAGTIYFTGYTVDLPANGIMDIPGWSFNGITIALIGFNSPLGILASSTLLSMLSFDGNDLDNVIGGYQIVNIMIAIMIIMIARSHYRIHYGKLEIKKTGFKVKFKKEKTEDEVSKEKLKTNKVKEGGDK